MAESDSSVDAVRRRWTSADFFLKWAALPGERRQRVLAELEETARESSARDPQFASDLTLAADVLDTQDNIALLELLKLAQADVHFLLSQISAKP